MRKICLLVIFILLFVGSAYGAGFDEKQGLTAGVGFVVETFAVAFGGGVLLHTGDLLPFLIYFSGNALENLSGYGLLTFDLGIGFRVGKILGSKNFLLLGTKYAIFHNGATIGFGVGFLVDVSFNSLGLYIFPEIGIVLTGSPLIPFIPMQINQLGVRYSF